MTVYSAYLWSPHKQLTALHVCISIKGSRVNSQYVCSARMYHGHYHAIISHPRRNSSLSRKLMIVCELISLFSLSLFLSLFSLSLCHAHIHTHTHTHSSRTVNISFFPSLYFSLSLFSLPSPLTLSRTHTHTHTLTRSS